MFSHPTEMAKMTFWYLGPMAKPCIHLLSIIHLALWSIKKVLIHSPGMGNLPQERKSFPEFTTMFLVLMTNSLNLVFFTL